MKRIIIPTCVGIGNIVLLTPLLLELKRLLPDCQRVIAGVSPCIDLLNVPQLTDEIIPVSGINHFRDILKKRCWKLIRRYDYALIPYTESFRCRFLKPLRKIGLIKNIVGFGSPNDTFISTLLPRQINIPERLQNLQILETLGLPVNLQRKADIFLSDAEKNAVIPILEGHGLYNQPFLAIHLSWRAGTEKKSFPANLLDEILQKLPPSMPKAILCGQEEKAAVQHFVAIKKHEVKLIDNIGSVRLLAAFLSYCRVMLTADTGPMHLAAAVGSNVLAVFGPTEKLRTAPDGLPNVRVFEKKMPYACNGCMERDEFCLFERECMTSLDAGMIADKILSFF